MKAIVLTFMILFTGCCESERQKYDFRLMSEFELLTRASEPNFFAAAVAGTEYGVDIRFANQSADTLWINWPEAKYIDEHGRHHSVLAYEGGGLPRPGEMQKARIRIETGSSRFYSVAAQEKVRLERVNCRRSATVYCPIVPWEDADAHTGRRLVMEMAKRSNEVSFVFPVAIGSRNEQIVIFLRPVALPDEARTLTSSEK